MTDKDGVRDISPETLYLNPLTGTPYLVINKLTYDSSTPKVQELYRPNPDSLLYSYFGRLMEKKDD